MENAIIFPLLCLGMVVVTVGKVQRQTSSEIAAMRLVNGRVPGQGRLEVQVADVWGSVCDDSFTDESARVVCRNLGFRSTYAKAVGTSVFGSAASTSAILLDEVACLGTEGSLNECQHRPVGVHNCDHSEDVGVLCDRSIRLVGGATEREGRLEVLVSGNYGTVCDDGFTEGAARVVCNQLGFMSNSSRRVPTSFYGMGSGSIVMTNVDCNGNEETIFRCSRPTTVSNCNHAEDVGIICGYVAAPHYSIRLVDGPNELTGRLEVRVNGTWGTICGLRSGRPVANIACGMLESSGVSRLSATAEFGKGEGPVYSVNCHSSARYLGECAYLALPVSVCGHPRDLGIVCNA